MKIVAKLSFKAAKKVFDQGKELSLEEIAMVSDQIEELKSLNLIDLTEEEQLPEAVIEVPKPKRRRK